MADLGAGAPRELITEQREEPFQSNLRAGLAPEELHRLIAEAAYYRAQRRGFSPGYEEQDWIEAEAEVMTRLGLWQ